MLIGVNEANGNNLRVTARLTSDTEKQAPPPRGRGGGDPQIWMFCPGVLLTHAICVSERNSCTSQIWTENIPVIPFPATGGAKGPLPFSSPFSSAEPDEVQNLVLKKAQFLLTVNNKIPQKPVIIDSLKRRVRNARSVVITPPLPDRLSGLGSGCSEGEHFTGVQSVDFTAEGRRVLKCDEITAQLLNIKHTGCFHISIKLLTEMSLVPLAACLC